MYSSYSTYPSTTSGLNNVSADSIVSTILGLGFFVLFLIGVAAILTIIGQWKLFSKAKREGCLALIPVANVIEELRMGGIAIGWWFLTFATVIPLVGWIAPLFLVFWKNIRLAKAFGKGAGTGVLLTFFPFVMYPVLGFGNAEYVGLEANNINQ